MSEGANLTTDSPRVLSDNFDLSKMRSAFRGAYVASDRYDSAMAMEAVADGQADLVSFARPYISNPDLVERLRVGAPLAEADPSTFYDGDQHGYLDYPTLARRSDQ